MSPHPEGVWFISQTRKHVHRRGKVFSANAKGWQSGLSELQKVLTDPTID